MSTFPGPDAASDDPWQHVARAREMNVIGRHDLALQYAHKGLAAHPGDPHLGMQLAIALYGLDRAPEAEAAAREAVAADPDSETGAIAFLGMLQLETGRHREAEQSFLEALRANPEYPYAWRQYGRLMSKVGRFDKARELLQRARAIDPEDAETIGLLAEVERDQERGLRARSAGDRVAAQATRKAMAQAPDDPSSQLVHALSELYGGRPFTARRLMREALAAAPSPELERAWLEADKLCRWTYQPAYWFGVLARKTPGGGSTLWIVCVGYGLLLRTFAVTSVAAVAPFVLFVFVTLYTWIADPVTRLWLKVVPPR